MLSDYAIWLREHAGWSFTVFYDTFDECDSSAASL